LLHGVCDGREPAGNPAASLATQMGNSNRQEMTMTTVKETKAGHAVSATEVTLSQHAPSIAQTIDQVRAQMPGWQDGVPLSGMPATGIHNGAETVSQRAGSAGNNGADPTHGGTESSLDLNAINDGLSALLAHAPLTDKDPT